MASFIKAYKWVTPLLLFTTALLAGRIVYTGNLTFIFLIWNTILAILPLYFSYKLQGSSSKSAQVMWAMLWLLFFPNSLYIVTDLFHLRDRYDAPKWYDLFLLSSAALNGAVLGFNSLKNIEEWMQVFVRSGYRSVIIYGVLLLTGYGIYLGRYERWNSWDVVTNPFALFASMLHHVIHPFQNIDVWVLSAAFATWMYLLYTYLLKNVTIGRQQ